MLGQVRKLIGLAAALALCACPDSASKSPPAATAPADAFGASLTAPGQVAVGRPGEVVVEVSARGGFHLNDEYPHAFRPTQGGGVQFDADKYDLRQGWERTPCPSEPDHACSFRTRVPFKATAKGAQRAAGVVALSVCNPDLCLIEKVPVSAAVEAAE